MISFIMKQSSKHSLDDALVAPDDRVVISKCHTKIDSTKTQKEPTYQVSLDTLKLSSCYNAFLITADVPRVCMHQCWFTISKIKDSSSYQFKVYKKKFRIGLGVFREILQICPSFPYVLGILKFVSKYEESQVYGKTIHEVMLSKEFMETLAYKTYLAFATGISIPKKARKSVQLFHNNSNIGKFSYS
ncbi:hypothetical protein Tco_1312829 [Tanacetum coccineum]